MALETIPLIHGVGSQSPGLTPSSSPLGRLGAEEGSWIVHQFFSAEELQLSPEEYVARHSHLLGNFSFHLYRYDNPVLGTWTRRIAQLLADDAEIERCRQRFLTRIEQDELRRQTAEV